MRYGRVRTLALAVLGLDYHPSFLTARKALSEQVLHLIHAMEEPFKWS